MITQLLIADSDTLVLDRCHGYFACQGYQVDVAADGLECLESLNRTPPDILVLERELLWGGGEGVLARLREDQWRWPATVIVTASDCKNDSRTMLRPPVKAVLQKPFSLASLSEAIRRAHYGDTDLAVRFLKRAQCAAELEQRRRERDLGFGAAGQSRFPRGS